MNENGIRISYERLFNMGDYEHEKYVVSKDVDKDSVFDSFKELSLKIVDFEEDLLKYRTLLNAKSNLRYDLNHGTDEQKEIASKKLSHLEKLVNAFKKDHKPVYKQCTCYYCTHPDDYDDGDYDDYE